GRLRNAAVPGAVGLPGIQEPAAAGAVPAGPQARRQRAHGNLVPAPRVGAREPALIGARWAGDLTVPRSNESVESLKRAAKAALSVALDLGQKGGEKRRLLPAYDEPVRGMVLEGTGTPLHATEVPEPQPRRGQVLVSVRACGVCRTDLHVVDGELTHPKLP